MPPQQQLLKRARWLSKYDYPHFRGYQKHDQESKSIDLSAASYKDVNESDLCLANSKDLRRFCSEIGTSYQHRKPAGQTKHVRLHLSKAQMLRILIRRKRKEFGVAQPKRKKVKRKSFEIEEVAWKEDIHKRTDGRIFNQSSGFSNDDKIRAWEVPGVSPMRLCSCETCNLHGRRRAEYILCSITKGRSNTYDVKTVAKRFEKERLNQFLPEGQLEAYISEACRNKTVLLSRPASSRVEETVDPKVPIGYEEGITFHACEYCNVIQHVNFKDMYTDRSRHLPTCRFHPSNPAIHATQGVGRPCERDFSDDEWSPITRFTCNAPHSEICPFNICRNADRYLPSVTQRGRLSRELRLADFACSFRYDAPAADAAAQAKEKKKAAQQDIPIIQCKIVGCDKVGDKTFNTKKNCNASRGILSNIFVHFIIFACKETRIVSRHCGQ